MKRLTLLLIIILSSFIISKAQISHGGIPHSWQENIQTSSIETIVLPQILTPNTKNTAVDKSRPFTFAKVIEINKSTDNAGQWIELNNGDKLWRIRLKSQGAYSLNIIFSRFLIPEGSELFIYTPDKKYKLGAFTSENNKENGLLATAAIPGDEIIVEYYEPEDIDFTGEISIGTIGHDYLNIFGTKDGQFGASGDCNIDVNCPEGNNWQAQKRSVCRMIIDNSELCTGVLVNNSLNNQTPYLLSANHCISTDAKAQSTVFYFNYESPSCNGIDGSTQQTVSGAELVATKNRDLGYLDFTLLKLSTDVPLSYKPYFAGWDSRENIPQESTCIHHPWGDVKKISHDFDNANIASYTGYGYDPNTFWRINYWDQGTTEGGSSGSPIFDKNSRIVGTLTGGEASCTVDSCDYFQMFSASYDKYDSDSMQLKKWLDPNNSGISFLDGFDTYDEDKEVEDLIAVAHWEQGQNLALYLANDGGFLAGNNIYQDKAKAEFFNKIEFGDRNAIVGANVAFGYATGRDDEYIELQVLKDNMGLPSTVLGSSFASLKEIKERADKDYVYFAFNPPIEISGSVYLSVVLPQFEGDTVAIMTVEEATINTAWELNYNGMWLPYSDPDESWGIKLSHIITMEVGRFTGINDAPSLSSEIKLFPNPANNVINIEFTNQQIKYTQIEIYDTFGRLISKKSVSDTIKNVDYNISNLKPGFYLMVIKSDNKVFSKKFIKE